MRLSRITLLALIVPLAGWLVIDETAILEPAFSTHIETAADVEPARARLIAEIFAGGLPTDTGTLAAIASPVPRLADLAAVEEIRMTRYAVRPVIWHPRRPNGRLMIMHQGHSWNYLFGNFPRALQEFLTAGFTVCGLVMPGGVDPYTSGSSMTHDSTEPPLADFIGPVIVAINTLTGYERVYMIGLSGGAWTATLAAAVDVRIAAVYNMAGNLPLYIKVNTSGRRDHEQRLPGLTASYQDLYLLGATPGRRHKQILFVNDDCCFNAAQYGSRQPYGEYIAALAAKLGGRFDLVWADKSRHLWHTDVIQAEVLPEVTPRWPEQTDPTA